MTAIRAEVNNRPDLNCTFCRNRNPAFIKIDSQDDMRRLVVGLCLPCFDKLLHRLQEIKGGQA